jgi:predicted nucleotidyltransferase
MAEEFCRPASVTDLLQMITSLNKKGAEYLLIGGYALYAHGIHRATEDIDLLVPARRDAAFPIIEALMILPDKTAQDLDPEWFSEGENIRMADEFVVDLILNTCQQNYDTLIPYLETIVVEGVPIRTLSIEGLLLTKQSIRDKDVSDRKNLENILHRVRQSAP